MEPQKPIKQAFKKRKSTHKGKEDLSEDQSKQIKPQVHNDELNNNSNELKFN